MADPYERLAEAQAAHMAAWKRQADPARKLLEDIYSGAPVSSLTFANYGGYVYPTSTSMALVGRRMLESMARPFQALQQNDLSDPALLDIIPFGGMTVYHATPHKWTPEPTHPKGRFRLDKIGTGEGAQAYGWGAYFAERPGVAKSYLPKPDEGLFNLPSGDLWSADALQHLNVRVTLRKSGDIDEAIRVAEDLLTRAPEATAGKLATDINTLKALKEAGGIKQAQGSLYKIDIPDELIEGRLLDWDKPLSEQPEAVQKSLNIMFTSADFLDTPFENATTKSLGKMRGQELYEQLNAMLSGFDDVGAAMSSKETSEMLRGWGIPGLRYYDSGSRTTQAGTRNLVIWDQGILDKAVILDE